MAYLENWIPKTKMGRMVKSGELRSIDQVIDSGQAIREQEIVDSLLPDLETDLVLVGQSKGKFGGGKRRAFKQTQKKTSEGSKIKFTCAAIAGNRNGYVGFGIGSSGETVPAKNKAIRNAKMNIIRLKRACGSWVCACGTPHSIPFKVEGKIGSVKIVLKPAPKGLGLGVSDECKKVLQLAGIKDVWSKTYGQTHTRLNLIKACFEALKQLTVAKYTDKFMKESGTAEGKLEPAGLGTKAEPAGLGAKAE
jgi:small subunit ribosomal protein S5